MQIRRETSHITNPLKQFVELMGEFCRSIQGCFVGNTKFLDLERLKLIRISHKEMEVFRNSTYFFINDDLIIRYSLLIQDSYRNIANILDKNIDKFLAATFNEIDEKVATELAFHLAFSSVHGQLQPYFGLINKAWLLQSQSKFLPINIECLQDLIGVLRRYTNNPLFDLFINFIQQPLSNRVGQSPYRALLSNLSADPAERAMTQRISLEEYRLNFMSRRQTRDVVLDASSSTVREQYAPSSFAAAISSFKENLLNIVRENHLEDLTETIITSLSPSQQAYRELLQACCSNPEEEPSDSLINNYLKIILPSFWSIACILEKICWDQSTINIKRSLSELDGQEFYRLRRILINAQQINSQFPVPIVCDPITYEIYIVVTNVLESVKKDENRRIFESLWGAYQSDESEKFADFLQKVDAKLLSIQQDYSKVRTAKLISSLELNEKPIGEQLSEVNTCISNLSGQMENSVNKEWFKHEIKVCNELWLKLNAQKELIDANLIELSAICSDIYQKMREPYDLGDNESVSNNNGVVVIDEEKFLELGEVGDNLSVISDSSYSSAGAMGDNEYYFMPQSISNLMACMVKIQDLQKICSDLSLAFKYNSLLFEDCREQLQTTIIPVFNLLLESIYSATVQQQAWQDECFGVFCAINSLLDSIINLTKIDGKVFYDTQQLCNARLETMRLQQPLRNIRSKFFGEEEDLSSDSKFHQYLSARNKTYAAKDFFFSADKRRREGYVMELNQLIKNYQDTPNAGSYAALLCKLDEDHCKTFKPRMFGNVEDSLQFRLNEFRCELVSSCHLRDDLRL